MKRSSLVCLGAVLVACQHMDLQSDTQPHSSSLGFRADVPKAWQILDARDVPESALDDAPSALANIDPALLADFSRAVRQGDMEVFYRPNPAQGFTDNVSVRSTPGGIPAAEEDLLAACEVLAHTLSAASGRPVALTVCELRDTARQPSLYVEANGAVEGVHSMQYLIEGAGGRLIIVTATAMEDTLPTLRRELDSMVRSLKFE